MEEQLINLETAKLAHTKGLDLENCQCIFPKYDGSEELTCPYFLAKRSTKEWYRIPTQALLQRWLREVHELNVSLNYKPNIKKWDFIVYDLKLNGMGYVKHYRKYYIEHPARKFDTYEQALEAGLFEALSQL